MDKTKREEMAEQLANDIVDSMDMGALIDCATEYIYLNLESMNEKDFQEDWNDFYRD